MKNLLFALCTFMLIAGMATADEVPDSKDDAVNQIIKNHNSEQKLLGDIVRDQTARIEKRAASDNSLFQGAINNPASTAIIVRDLWASQAVLANRVDTAPIEKINFWLDGQMRIQTLIAMQNAKMIEQNQLLIKLLTSPKPTTPKK